jgi:hypothetical protein
VMVGLSTERLLRCLELARAGTDAQTLEQRDIELGVNAAIEVAAGGQDAALPFKHPKVLRTNPQLSSRFGDMNVAVHALERSYRAISPPQANFSEVCLSSIRLLSVIECTPCGVKRLLYCGSILVNVLPEGVDVPGVGAVSEKPLLTIYILV